MGPRRLLVVTLAIGITASACGTGGGTPGSTTTTEPLPEPVTTVALPDGLDTFMADFETAIQEADVEYLVEHLHPAVIDLYGREQCGDELLGIIPRTVQIHATAVGDPGQWTMDYDATPVLIPDTYELTVVYEEAEVRTERVLHIGERFGQYHWFTDCGNPQEVPGGPSA